MFKIIGYALYFLTFSALAALLILASRAYFDNAGGSPIDLLRAVFNVW